MTIADLELVEQAGVRTREVDVLGRRDNRCEIRLVINANARPASKEALIALWVSEESAEEIVSASGECGGRSGEGTTEAPGRGTTARQSGVRGGGR